MHTASPSDAPLHYARMLIRAQRRFALSASAPAGAPPAARPGPLRLVSDNERHAMPRREAPRHMQELAAA